MSIKFRDIKVRGRYFSRVFKFAIFLKSRKSRIQGPAKVKENKVSKGFISQHFHMVALRLWKKINSYRMWLKYSYLLNTKKIAHAHIWLRIRTLDYLSDYVIMGWEDGWHFFIYFHEPNLIRISTGPN